MNEIVWTARDRLLAAVVAVALLLMVGVPLYKFTSDEPGRFAWHMFSVGRALPDFTVVPEAGDPWTIDVENYMAVLRSDLPIEEELPAHLCRQIPEAVTIETVAETGTETFVC